MKFKRIAATLAWMLAACAAPVSAQAQAWPAKPVKIVTAFGAGSASDIVARMIAEDLQAAFKQPFVVDNKPGASGILAAEMVAKSAPDGYTLFLTTNTAHSVNPFLFKTLPYDPIKDFTPIARVCYFPFVLAVNGQGPVKTIPELLAYARNPANKTSYAYGNSTGQIAGAAFTNLTRIGSVAVPYKSTPQALTDLIGGQVTFLFVDLASSRPHLQSGRIRALGVTVEQKGALTQDLPSVASAAQLPGFDLAAWVGVVGPAGVPPAIVNQVSERINQMLARKEVVEKLTALGADVAPGNAAELGGYMKSQLELWGRKVREAGIQPE
ncbi:Bug family tripartite tricarboxylate transporter substrate binding protein [Ramlibacter sp. MAHUQ-53]|uniref:Bug family tripartite tricarboxylate transporter substrate binding protein n=1 Tax=unclassified Ramlibacter TaxID=2617605 RepID=UPI00362CAA97